MDHFVTLAKLPEGLEFPENLRDRIRYDSENKRLVYHGFMVKSHYDRLIGLSRDAEYPHAIEQLFVLATNGHATASNRRNTVLLVALLTVLVFVSRSP
ncbi:MAG: hypothetical protein H6822_02085 [Planctomycetaceae bacterium]|nr:hypothetical protein [Planctomycetales bacterium]MCB9920939.1 hypothetical protein [Planctomycetaceae bacterium]